MSNHRQVPVGVVLPRSIDDVIAIVDACRGFDKEHYSVSMAVGERVLLPAVRQAPQAAIIANGFSCREQIRQATTREACHFAELVCQAIGGRQ